MTACRFIVNDELGPVRAFHDKGEALAWMRLRPELYLVVLPRVRRSRIDLSQFPDAPF
jgi:hypothetical protein